MFCIRAFRRSAHSESLEGSVIAGAPRRDGLRVTADFEGPSLVTVTTTTEATDEEMARDWAR